MASASASIVLSGKVKKTKIARDGTAVVVKKSLGDGATIEDRFPKRRMKGKRKANDQMIPVEDVVRGMEEYAQSIKPEVQRRIQGVHQLANELLDQEIAKERRRTRHQAGKTVAAKQATRAARRVAGENKRQANEALAVANRALAQSARTQSLAEAIAKHYNEA
jgi:hypothetical protein